MPSAVPKISIVTATYNWSAALACAIESVLSQTFREFEMLVVGDGCTDDSEKVVSSFNDRRVKWINLPSNSGNQVTPNNAGIAESNGEYIAYLGHDDVWYPSHLESLFKTAERTHADVIGGVAILYGPPDSGLRGVSGVMEHHVFTASDFMVPSSILHRHDLINRIGMWRAIADSVLPPDFDFLKRAHDAGATFAFTDEVTTFKFNAAWRKNSYRLKTTSEQQEMLAKIKGGGDFRQKELVEVVRATLSGRYIRVQAPDPEVISNVEIMRYNADFKGSNALKLHELTETMRFDLTEQLAGHEWYELETNTDGSFRWSGPSLLSTVSFPVRCGSGITLDVCIVRHFQDDLARSLEIRVNGHRVQHGFVGEHQVQAHIPAHHTGGPFAGLPLTIAFRVKKTQRPVDLGLNSDNRPLGIAVSWVQLSPVANGSSAAVEKEKS